MDVYGTLRTNIAVYRPRTRPCTLVKRMGPLGSLSQSDFSN